MPDVVLTYLEAKEVLGLRYQTTITDMVEKLGLTPKPIRRNGAAKGLDRSDLAKMRRALKIRPARIAQPA